MTGFVVVGMKSPHGPLGPSLGMFLTLEEALRWVHDGHMPPEWPFYAMTQVEGDLYVVVSKTHTDEQIKTLASLGKAPPMIFSGPHTTENAEVAVTAAKHCGWKSACVSFIEKETAVSATWVKKPKR